MPKPYIVSHGRTVVDTGFDRGSTLIWTPEEWKTRRREYNRNGIKVMLRFWVIFSAVTLLIVFAMHIILAEESDWPLTLVFSTVGLCLLPFCWPIWNHLTQGEGPGLYEHGVQLLLYEFIPYTEIASTECRPIGWRGESLMRLHPRHEKRGIKGMLEPEPWVIPVAFLGEEGVEELERRVHAPGSPL